MNSCHEDATESMCHHRYQHQRNSNQCSNLGKCLLAIVLQVSRIHIEVVVVHSEGLWALGNAWHKLFHLEEDLSYSVVVKLLDWDVGWSHAIYAHKGRVGGEKSTSEKHSHLEKNVCFQHALDLESLLVMSRATPSTVMSRFPKITGSLAIFSGLETRRK